jgi:hypothetical protein
MKLKLQIFLIILFVIYAFNSYANDLDNAAACAGVIVGNAGIELMNGKEENFNNGLDVAYTGLLGQQSSKKYSQEDTETADLILESNIDKIVIAYNNQAFNANTYEEILNCYSKIGSLILKNRKIIDKNFNLFKTIITKKKKLLKRLIEAG